MSAAPICPACGKAVVPDAPQGLCPQCLMKSGFDIRAPHQPGDGNTRFIPPPTEQIGRLFPQLEIIALLGQGGMGAVYKGRQPALGRFVALKILPPKSAEDPGFAERFNREARALARLNHPNIVAVYDFGQAGGMSYFLMEYVEGSTLRQVAQSGRLSPRETLGVITQICEALQFAHDEGVVHRDIKPENILLDQKGRVKIADFGIAKVLHREPQDIALTEAKEIIGTAHYMAPEQIEHPNNVDHRADIFSLGVVFYELLTGELPLGKFAPPSQTAHSDARLDEVVLHTLEKEPGRRYQQARQVQHDVEAIAASAREGVPPQSQVPAPIRATVPPRNGVSHGWKVAAVAGVVGLAALLVLGVLAFLFWWSRTPSAASAASHLAHSNAVWTLLNDDQRLVAQWFDRKFRSFDDERTFEGWPERERAILERHLLETLRGPHAPEFFRAINTLAALRSTNALPELRKLAFARLDKQLRSELSNRPRWMAVRALARIGDKTAVPELIHLLYYSHPYPRWWAQISLVQLTGRNFGPDWKAWGEWWNGQSSEPPFNPQTIRWWKGQAGPEQLAQRLSESDQRFISQAKTSSAENQALAEVHEPDHKTQEPTQ